MEEKKQNAFMAWWMPKWRGFEEKSPNLAKWVYKIFYFFVFSMGVTIIQFIILLFLPVPGLSGLLPSLWRRRSLFRCGGE